MSVKCCVCVHAHLIVQKGASNLFPLCSQTKYRQKADSIGFTPVADDLATLHAKKSQELQSDVSLFTLRP